MCSSLITEFFEHGFTLGVTLAGLAWLLPFAEITSQFTGTQTYRMDELNVIDATGNPIIVRALLEFAMYGRHR